MSLGKEASDAESEKHRGGGGGQQIRTLIITPTVIVKEMET